MLKGYVVDLACLRKYPRDEWLERARAHTRNCALMGHCVESGYGLVDERGGLAILDSGATQLVVDALRSSPRSEGITLLATRELNDEEMRTVRVEEVLGG
jgi:hypothetical protein